MIRYAYVQQIKPPAPFVQVRLQNPVTGDSIQDVPAQLDLAADRTLIPGMLVEQLKLVQMGDLRIGGVGGFEQVMPTYPLSVGIHDLPLQSIEVVASSGESWVLLGRDILNAHRLLLDGPQLSLEIGS